MAAPRRYSDAQRSEIFRLHEAGLTSEQISDTCAKGTAAVQPFTVPRRTVSDIISRIAEENRLSVPESAGDVDGLETVWRFPGRIARIFDAEIERLAAKQRRGQLTAKDLELLRKATEISGPLSKRLEGSPRRDAGTSRSTKKVSGRPQPEEGTVARLAREEREAKGGAERVVDTHTHQDPVTT